MNRKSGDLLKVVLSSGIYWLVCQLREAITELEVCNSWTVSASCSSNSALFVRKSQKRKQICQ